MLQVRHYKLTDIEALAADWHAIEPVADVSYFLSWHWIGCWLTTYQPNAIVIEARDSGVVCGLGVVVLHHERRHGFVKSAVLRLHQTGVVEQDQIWIEYNGWLTRRDDAERISQQMTTYLCNQYAGWDEIILGAICPERAEAIARAGYLHWVERWAAPCFGIDLKALREREPDYLQSISHNTRYQIRRSMRFYQQLGTVQVQRPATMEQALAWFDRIGPLHIRRWGSGKGQSGFANPAFVDFHRRLIQQGWEQGTVDIIALVAGEQHIATFYNLIYRNRVYFYLSGIEPVLDNKQKPGLLGHSLCIQHYLNQGLDFYDFMGGNERYKLQLGHWHGRLVQVSLQKSLVKFKIESLGRMVKQLFGNKNESEGRIYD